MSVDVLDLLSSAVTEIQALRSQVSIAIGPKKKTHEPNNHALLSCLNKSIVCKLTN